MELNPIAVQIAVKIIKQAEGCSLRSYPDPASSLYAALSTHGMLQRYMSGAITYKNLPDNFKALSGKPFTIAYGYAVDIEPDTIWTQEQANAKLEEHVRTVMSQCLEDCPQLANKKPEQIAACTSLAYNIGRFAFKNSTAARHIMEGNDQLVGDAIKMWCKAKGLVMAGLVTRRQVECNLWNSGR
jgi:lysozyme